jgi:hypothetical protein
MPLLGALISFVMGKLMLFMAFMAAKRLLSVTLAIAALTTITGVLISVMHGVVIPLANAAFSTSYGQFLGLAFPPIAGTCIAGLMAIWSACALYAWQRTAIGKLAGI